MSNDVTDRLPAAHDPIAVTSPHAARATWRGPGRGLIRWTMGIVPLILGLLLWEVLSTDDARSFPQPSSWWTATGELWSEGDLRPALVSTLLTFIYAMVVATVLGVGLGMLIGFHPRLERALTPLIDFFRTLPPPVVVPVLGLILGISRQASVAIVVVAIVWPIVLNTVNAVHEMPAVRREIASVLGLGRVEAFWKISLPSLTEGIVVGIRIALSLALVVALLVDILGGADGVGRLLVEQQQFFEAPAVWALLFLIGLAGYLINLAIQGTTRVLLRHHPTRANS